MSNGPKQTLTTAVAGMTPSATVAINERCDAMRIAGTDVFKLGLGQSPFPVPGVVVDALRRHAAEKDYLPVRGLRALRDAVAGFHNRREGLSLSGDGVLIGPGSKELMFLVQLVHGGELLLPSPSWVSYAPQARLAGRPVRWIETRRDSHWKLSVDALDSACRDADAPAILILNYPNNPTGGTYSHEELSAIADVARSRGVVILSDEIYGELHHRGEHVSIARFYPEGTVISSGLSKWCGAGGWRLGTFAFPAELEWLSAAVATAASETFTSTSAPIQHAAITAFSESPELSSYLDRSRAVLAALGAHVATRLRSAGLFCTDPEGGFYVMVDGEALRERLTAAGVNSGEVMCERALTDTGVAFLPGSEFGRPATELSARLAYVNFDGTAALAAAATDTVDDAFVRRHCEPTCEAIDMLARWFEAL